MCIDIHIRSLSIAIQSGIDSSARSYKLHLIFVENYLLYVYSYWLYYCKIKLYIFEKTQNVNIYLLKGRDLRLIRDYGIIIYQLQIVSWP